MEMIDQQKILEERSEENQLRFQDQTTTHLFEKKR